MAMALPALNVGLAVKGHSDCTAVSERFELKEELGQGSSAVVYRARPRGGGDEVALKVVRTDDEGVIQIAKDEFELLKGIRHPHIVRAHEVFTYGSGVAMVMELFDGVSLEKAVARATGRRLPEVACRTLFKQLASAVGHLHERHIVHRDVKAGNILVNGDLTDLRLVDFNTAQNALEGGALTLTGTMDYLPPEVIRGDSHTFGSDIWASGLCLYLMASGVKPLQLCAFGSHEAFAQAVVRRAAAPLEGGAWDEASPHCKEAVRLCLEPELEMRASAWQLLACEWLRT